MNLILELGLNAIMAVLLSATIFYCWLLNKRIQILQDSKSELANLLKHFDRSTVKASESILALQDASRKVGETIHARIEKAHYALDDLSYMIDRANKVADQMEAGLAIARQKDKLQKVSPASPTESSSKAKDHLRELVATKNTSIVEGSRIEAKPELLHQTPKTLQDAIQIAGLSLGEEFQSLPEKVSKAVKSATSNAQGTTLSSLQALIEKVAERRSDPVLRGNQRVSAGLQATKPRSQGEEDLLEALRFSSKV